MPYLPGWNEELHGDIISRPLKGEHIDTLLEALKQMQELSAHLHGSIGDTNTDPTFRMIEGVFKELKKRLSNPGLKAFGIDYQDFKGIVSRVCNSPTFDYEEAHSGVTQLEHSTGQSLKHDMADAAEGSMGSYLLGFFSACLAVQEGRVEEYKPLAEQFSHQQYQLMYQQVLSAKASGDETLINGVTGSLFASEVMALHELAQARKNNKGLADIYETVTDGVVENLRAAVAELHGIDRDSQRGGLELREMERKGVTHLAQALKLPVDLPPDIAGGRKY